MNSRFRGEFENKLDTKGRLSIPASFRRVIEACDPEWKEGLPPRFILVYGGKTRNYLECFTIQAMQEVDSKIDKHPRGSKKRKAMERLYSTQTVELTIDDTGRIVLPADQRRKIDLSDMAMIAASGDTFEIWEPATYRAVVEDEDDEGFDPDVDPSVYVDEYE